MSIPNFNKDLSIISKLSDLPNATDGLTAEQLKAKFDQAGLEIQKWINETLLPQLKAANVPFAPTSEIRAQDVQGAIQLLQTQIRDAATGSIVNGSITREKLAAELLARVYGGRPWVSLDTPGSGQNPETDFPVGQIWLRPGFTVVNAAGNGWTASGCTVAAEDNKITVTGNQTVATAVVSQALSGLGQSGDRVYILLDIRNKDSELTGLTISIDGGGEQEASGGPFLTHLGSGGLTVKLTATWPSTSLADGSFEIVNYAVVNVDQILRQTADAQDMADWPAYLESLLPLGSDGSPEAVYIQVKDGQWWPFGFDILPFSRGGLGFGSIGPGELLVGGDGALEKLPAAAEEKSLLQSVGGKARWSPLGSVGFPMISTGSYTGNGGTQTVTLPLSPKLLYVYAADGIYLSGAASYSAQTVADRPALLADGATDGVYYSYPVGEGSKSTTDRISLNGTALKLTSMVLCNRSGVTYNWVAVS